MTLVQIGFRLLAVETARQGMERSEPFDGIAKGSDALALFMQIIQDSMRQKMPPVIRATRNLRADIHAAIMAASKPILFEGALPASIKQMIVLTIASRRGCGFCIEFHRAMLEAMGIDESLIQSCIDDPEMRSVPPMYRQMLQFAQRAAQNPQRIEDSEFEALRDSGLNDDEILELSMLTAFTVFLVTWAAVPAHLAEP